MRLLKTPTHIVLLIWALILAASVLTVQLALQSPRLGLRLLPTPAGAAVSVVTAPAGSGIPAGARVLSVSGRDGRAVTPLPLDLIEEPDFLDTYAEINALFARQDLISEILRSGEVKLSWRTANGASGESILSTRAGTLGDLPLLFWFQLVIGHACLLISAWVYALRPKDWGPRMFLLSGLAFSLATSSTAIYSSRELALPESLFRTLSMSSHLGGIGFGSAIVGLFMCYPRMLVKPRHLLWVTAIYGAWFVADVLQWATSVDWGFHLPLVLQLVIAFTLAAIQWQRARNDPLSRAALRWFMLSTLVACSLYVTTISAPNLLDLQPLLPQGYALGFLLIMYVGIALGLRRYRLFDIDEWAYRVLLWIAGASAVILLDVLLILVGVKHFFALGISLLLAGWLYFPLRQWLWQQFVSRHQPRLESLLPQLSDFAFLADESAREAHWDAILRRAFDPLDIVRTSFHGEHAAVQDDGLALSMPAVGGLAARKMSFAAGGSRLFSSRDANFADALIDLVGQILASRASFEQGARAERQRLARDLHDNLGARLLRLIHHLRGTNEAEIAREAMVELRSAIAAIDAPPMPLADALADWRAEASMRCAEARIELSWHQGKLPALILTPRVRAALASILREAVTNALKHARPRAIGVSIGAIADHLEIVVENDGPFTDPAQWREGYGLRSMRARLNDLDGAFVIDAHADKVRLRIFLPIENLHT